MSECTGEETDCAYAKDEDGLRWGGRGEGTSVRCVKEDGEGFCKGCLVECAVVGESERCGRGVLVIWIGKSVNRLKSMKGMN